MKKIFATLTLALLAALTLQAQDAHELIKADPALSAGYYHSYEITCSDSISASRPEGYTPFYISHYGRHGSRWHSSERKYLPVLKVLEKAEAAKALTPTGRELLEKIRIISADAEGRYGDLSPRGVREHRGIAERMYLTYPEVFSTHDGEPAEIDSKSTVVVRCILSMAAFNERLKELSPEMKMTRESSRRNMYYMGNHRMSDSLKVWKRAGAVSDSLRKAWIRPERFLRSIFSDRKFVRNEIAKPQIWMYDVFQIAGDMECIDYLDIDLYEYFTDKELYDLWRCINAYGYMTMGPSLRFGDINMEDARPLLRNIIASADEVIAGRSSIDAHLRFGHDSNILPLMSLIGIENVAVRVSLDDVADHWNLSKRCPMATNLQFIFFRPEGAVGNDDVKVRVLYNERDAGLPLEGAPFYSWENLRTYLSDCLQGR